MPVSVCMKLSCDYSLTKLGPVQANVKVHNSSFKNVIGSCVPDHHIHKSPQALTINIIDIEGSVFLSFAEKPELGLLQES